MWWGCWGELKLIRPSLGDCAWEPINKLGKRGGELSLRHGNEGRNNDLFQLVSCERSSWRIYEQLEIQVRSSGAKLKLDMEITRDS